jgi:hypothetical protein
MSLRVVDGLRSGVLRFKSAVRFTGIVSYGFRLMWSASIELLKNPGVMLSTLSVCFVLSRMARHGTHQKKELIIMMQCI